MNEKGIDPPEGLELEPTSLHLAWLKRLQDAFPKVQTFTSTIDPASVAANTTAEQTFTLTGITTNDIIVVNKPTVTAGLGIVGARASAANQIGITFGNFTGSPIDPPSESYFILAVRR